MWALSECHPAAPSQFLSAPHHSLLLLQPFPLPPPPPPPPTPCSFLSPSPPSPPQRLLLLPRRVFPCLFFSPLPNNLFLFSGADRSDTSCALSLSLPPLSLSHPPSAAPFLTQFHFFTHCAAPTAPHMLLGNSTALIHILDSVLIPLIILLNWRLCRKSLWKKINNRFVLETGPNYIFLKFEVKSDLWIMIAYNVFYPISLFFGGYFLLYAFISSHHLKTGETMNFEYEHVLLTVNIFKILFILHSLC